MRKHLLVKGGSAGKKEAGKNPGRRGGLTKSSGASSPRKGYGPQLACRDIPPNRTLLYLFSAGIPMAVANQSTPRCQEP